MGGSLYHLLAGVMKEDGVKPVPTTTKKHGHLLLPYELIHAEYLNNVQYILNKSFTWESAYLRFGERKFLTVP
jgi:hypothetical protein